MLNHLQFETVEEALKPKIVILNHPKHKSIESYTLID